MTHVHACCLDVNDCKLAKWQTWAQFFASTMFPIAMLVLALAYPSALLALRPLDSAWWSAFSTQCNVPGEPSAYRGQQAKMMSSSVRRIEYQDNSRL